MKGVRKMFEIDYVATIEKAKSELDFFTKNIQIGFYRFKQIPLIEVNETELLDLMIIELPTKYDDLMIEDVKLISRLDKRSKEILYCVHCLMFKRRNLRSENAEYSFGNPYKYYNEAVLNFGLAREDLTVYL